MITDIFARRYEGVLQFNEYHAHNVFRALFTQAAHIFFSDLQPALGLPERFFRDIHDRLARELGLPALSFEQVGYIQKCGTYLIVPYNLWDDSHGTRTHRLRNECHQIDVPEQAGSSRGLSSNCRLRIARLRAKALSDATLAHFSVGAASGPSGHPPPYRVPPTRDILLGAR
jgi:hypothetical protein